MLIKNGTIVTEGGTFVGDVAARDGRISALGEGLQEDGPVVDASNCHVLPGAVDPHVHVAIANDPNMEPVIETLAAASAAAIMGGTTTISAYVRGYPGVSLEDAIRSETEHGLRDAQTDFALNALFHPDQDYEADVRAAAGLGVTSFKAMMAYHVRGLMLDDGELLRLMSAVAAVGGLALIHAENGLATEYLETVERRRSGGPVEPASYLRSSPGLLEAEGMHRATMLSRLVGCRVLFVHMSARESASVFRTLKKGPDGPRIFCETQPHYLALTNRAVLERGALGKIGPPLKEQEDVDAVWEVVRSGYLSHLSSDHNPRTVAMKSEASDIFGAPYGGISGTEVLLPLAWSLGYECGRLSVEDVARLTATHAARVYGLYPQKGAIRIGSDADLVVIPKEGKSKAITPENLHGRSDYTLYEGLSSRGFPLHVVRGGELAVSEGERLSNPPARYLARDPH